MGDCTMAVLRMVTDERMQWNDVGDLHEGGFAVITTNLEAAVELVVFEINYLLKLGESMQQRFSCLQTPVD